MVVGSTATSLSIENSFFYLKRLRFIAEHTGELREADFDRVVPGVPHRVTAQNNTSA